MSTSALTSLAVTLVATLAAIILALLTVATSSRRSRRLDVEVEKVRKRIPESASPQEKQFALLREYAAQGLVQAKVSFWVSHVAAGVGFGVIVFGVVLLYTDRTGGAGLVSTAAGAVTEAVSVLFFRQTNKTRELMIQTFDRLRTDRKLDEALRLLESRALGDGAREKVASLLTLDFAEVKPAEPIVEAVIGGLVSESVAADHKEPLEPSEAAADGVFSPPPSPRSLPPLEAAPPKRRRRAATSPATSITSG